MICGQCPEQRAGRAWIGNSVLEGRQRPAIDEWDFRRGRTGLAARIALRSWTLNCREKLWAQQVAGPGLSASAESASATASAAATKSTTSPATAATKSAATSSATTAPAATSTNPTAATVVSPATTIVADPTAAAATGWRTARSDVASEGGADVGEGVVDAAGEALYGGDGDEGDQGHNQGVLRYILRMLVTKHALQK
jgi:hypothetical protein